MMIDSNHGYKKGINRGNALCKIYSNSNVDSEKITLVSHYKGKSSKD